MTTRSKPTWQSILRHERRLLGLCDDDLSKPDGVGLALSGGGIRSGAFALGVIQCLAEKGHLKRVDYLSTVSGGGYIGAWLSTYLHRLSPLSAKEKVAAMNQGLLPRITERQEKELERTDLASLRYIRRFSSYLTPETGLSRDLLSTAGIVITNLLLSLIIVTSLLLGLAFFVLFIGAIVQSILASEQIGTWFLGALLLATLLAFVAVICFTPAIDEILGISRGTQKSYRPETAVRVGSWMLVTSLLLLSFAVVIWTLSYAEKISLPFAAFDFALVDYPKSIGKYLVLSVEAMSLFYFFVNLPLIVLTGWDERTKTNSWLVGFAALGRESFLAFVSGGIGGTVLFSLIFALDYSFFFTEWTATVLGIPFAVSTVVVTMTIHLMLEGRALPPELREWWYRVISTLMGAAPIWTILAGAAVIGPALFRGDSIRWISAAAVAWTSSAAFTTIMALGRFTGKSGENKLLVQLTPIAIWILITGLVLAAFAGAYHFLGVGNVQSCRAGISACVYAHAYKLGQFLCSDQGLMKTSLFALITTIGLVFFNLHYNINLHSMNQLYRNRLVRCFLGATNVAHDDRSPSGFDHKDDYPLAKLSKQRPMHIFCASINLSGTKELAWQTRKALSFMFTPFYVGYTVPMLSKPQSGRDGQYAQGHFVRTTKYMNQEDDMTVGNAMTISGAAVSPNQGYHTNKGLAFLMALANARTGRWCPNPAGPVQHKLDPGGGVWWFIKELFGSAHERGKFVYLSDGGHFENMGLYELARRRCAKIIVIDGEQDNSFRFDGLAEGMRKARLDLNAEISLSTEEIRPPKSSRHSKTSFALGTIVYDHNRDRRAEILYIKLSLPKATVRDVPADVWSYATLHTGFPYEHTTDQWFDETQFEAYRKLGYAIAKQVWAEKTSAQFFNPTFLQNA